MTSEYPTYEELMVIHDGTPFARTLGWLAAKTHKQRLVVLRSMLDDCYLRLTDNRQVNQGHSEDALSLEIVGMLSVSQVEASHDNRIGGHCDITVKARDGFLWIGEAKIHSSYDWLLTGFEQLSTRYGLAQYGRDNGEIIIYHRAANSKGVLEKWRDKLIAERGQVSVVKDEIDQGRLNFETKHNCVASGYDYFTRHVIVPMHHAPEK